MVDIDALRQSVDLENRADLMAVSGDFREAAWLMKKANEIRRANFGPYSINELRDLTASAIEARQRTDPEGGLDPEGESAVPPQAGDAQ